MKEKPVLWGSLGVSFGIGGLYELREYHNTMERVILNTGKWQISSVAKRVKKIPQYAKEDFITRNYPYRWVISYPSALRNSIVIAGMSYFESQLDNISRDAEFYSGKTFQKPNKNTLRSYREFLIKSGKLNISSTDGWKKLNSIYRLRNILIHNGMNLGDKDGDSSAQIEEIRNNVPGISLDDDGFYIIDCEFCDQMFVELEEFFNGIESQIKNKWET